MNRGNLLNSLVSMAPEFSLILPSLRTASFTVETEPSLRYRAPAAHSTYSPHKGRVSDMRECLTHRLCCRQARTKRMAPLVVGTQTLAGDPARRIEPALWLPSGVVLQSREPHPTGGREGLL
jgi:hypothetical protein